MNRGMAMLVAGVLVAGCTTAPVASSRASGPPATPSQIPPTASSAPLSSPTAPGPSALAGIRFEQVVAAASSDLDAAMAFSGGFLVGGCWLQSAGDSGGDCVNARILYSADGRTWTDGVVSDPAGMHILGLADTSLGLLAFGANQAPEPPLTRSVWRSTDGRRWEPFPVPAPASIVFTKAFVLAGRTVLVGLDSAYDLSVESEVWATTDGRSWTSGKAPITTKVAASPGLVAIGDGCVDLCPANTTIQVERSVDGLTWASDPPNLAMAGDRLRAVGSWAGQAVTGGALTEGSASEAVVWYDESGAWPAVVLDEGLGYSVQTIVDAGDRLLVIGHPDVGPNRAWLTSDGRTWEHSDPEGIEDSYIQAWAGTHPLVVVESHSVWLLAD